MSILNRFTDIISSNINAVLNRMEDPEKMIDEYLRQLLDDLAEVKSNTAEVMAEESRAKRKVDENEAEILKSLENHCKDKTVVMVSHRKSSAAICDKKIYVKNNTLSYN